VAPLPLGTTDVPEMLELAAPTEPGPFFPQTIQMESYFAIRASDLTTFLAAQILAAGLLRGDFCAILRLDVKKRRLSVDLVKLVKIAISPILGKGLAEFEMAFANP
jgi:hypothetical protein